ncbi:MAG: HD domain-containing protein [Chloroflexi bacterium]|nr:HD domain-containing protein [Chloroflexota bacterium]MBI4505515.1 HD domain-containing protein [Chloroflexota bacterium]
MAGAEPLSAAGEPAAPGADAAPESVEPARGELIRLPARHNELLAEVTRRVNADVDLHTLWRCANVNAVDRLGMSDHGPVHVQIVANIALRLLRLLVAGGLQPSIVRDHHLDPSHAELVVALAALLHDLGMSIHRSDHEAYSLFLANGKLRELLAGLLAPPELTIVVSETLHAIIAHRADGKPFTLEAGIVRVADALDLAKGRSRIPFEAGQVNIHSLSAAAIERVDIQPGDERAVRITIHMSSDAGIFQVDELLREKLRGSGLEAHVAVEAVSTGTGARRLVEVFRL